MGSNSVPPELFKPPQKSPCMFTVISENDEKIAFGLLFTTQFQCQTILVNVLYMSVDPFSSETLQIADPVYP